VVDEGQPGGGRQPEVGDLHRRRPIGQHARARAQGLALQVDQDVDLVAADELRRLLVAERVDALEVVHGADDALAQRGAVLAAPVEGVDLEAAAVVQLEQLHRQHGHRVHAEVTRAVGDAQPSWP
jgi:hypothetical protein